MKSIMALLLTMTIDSVLMAQGRDVSYTEGTAKLKGYYVKPDKATGKTPGVLIIHAWKGINPFVQNTAKKLSLFGYHAFAGDIYGEDNRPATTEEAGKTSGYYKNNREIYRSRIKAGLDQLIKAGADPEHIAVIGYCFGGTGALEAARANFKINGVVSFHGGLNADPKMAESSVILPKVLVLHGADDPSVPEEQVNGFRNEMRSRKADWQIIYYANAVHAFTEPEAGNDNSKGAAYNAEAATRSWEHMKLFLRELFER